MSTDSVEVLVVEDDDVDIMAIRRAFQKRKLCNRIHVARDGHEALDFLRSAVVARPYVIILDLNMPRMNGFEFLQALRQDPVHRNAVVFVLSTSPAAQDRAAVYHANVAGYVEKSGDGDCFAELLALLERYWAVVTLP